MKLRIALAAALAGAFVVQAQAQQDITCAELVDQVDSLLVAQSQDLNEEVLGQILSLRNQGSEECANGDDAAAAESLEHAISLFSQ